MKIRTIYSLEMSNEEFSGATADVVKRLGDLCKSKGTTDMAEFTREDMEQFASQVVTSLITRVFEEDVKIDIDPPY